MLVSGFMHSQDHGYSGSALRQGHTVAAQRRIHTGLPPRRRLSAFAVGRVYVEEKVRERQDLFGGAATHSSDVVVFLFRTAPACA